MSGELEIRSFRSEDEPDLMVAYTTVVEEGGAFARAITIRRVVQRLS